MKRTADEAKSAAAQDESAQERKGGKLIKVMQIVSLVLILGFVIFCLIFVKARGMTYRDIVDFTPNNLWLAALVFVGLFVLRTPMLVFPPPILYIAVGFVFSSVPIAAILVSLIGTAACHPVPFYLGRFSGGGVADRLISKYPKVSKLDRLRTDNEFFFVYIIKLIGLIPSDVCGLIMGAWKFNFKKYYFASMIGSLPHLLVYTILGVGVSGDANLFKSPLLYVLISAIVVMAAVSIVIYKKYMKKRAD